jgi:hypothetical protein
MVEMERFFHSRTDSSASRWTSSNCLDISMPRLCMRALLLREAQLLRRSRSKAFLHLAMP